MSQATAEGARVCQDRLYVQLFEKKDVQQMNRQTAKKAFLSTLPVMAGYGVLSIGFGILLNTKGYGIGWALAMSIFIFAGSMQYLAVDLLTGGASLITTAVTTFMVNARHLFYGISMIDKYRNTGWRKPYLIFALTDETYSLNCGDVPEGVDNPKEYYFLVSLFNHSYWVIGTAIGSLLGNIIPFNTEGIDFALTALFVTIFVEQWLSTQNHFPAITGVVSAVLCLFIFGKDDFLIPTMIMIATILIGKRGKEKEAKKNE